MSVGVHMEHSSGFSHDTRWYSKCFTLRHHGKGQTSYVDVVPGQSRTCIIMNLVFWQTSRIFPTLCLRN